MFGQKRLDAIFEAVCHSTFAPAARLAKIHGITDRTVRSDIARINSALENHGAYIDIKRGQGYHLVVQDAHLYEDFIASTRERGNGEPDLSNTDDRIRFLLNALLMANDHQSYDQLADIIFVGENTLQN